MEWYLLASLILVALPLTSNMLDVPDTALNCCEGDILLLLDSSGSVSSYESLRLLRFVADLLSPFSLGPGHVRVALLQVSTNPRLEFGLGTHQTQGGLKRALLGTKQLLGDTNTEAALRLARQHLLAAGGAQPEQEPAALPKVLVWLTDGVEPGDVDGLMSELKRDGVAVLAVSTGHGNFKVLQRSVTPPVESHLYFVDIDDISLITEDLREAIIEIIRAERLRVVHVSSHSAVLQWRPVLSAETGYYQLRYNCVRKTEREHLSGARSRCTGQQHKRTQPGDSSRAELTNLLPDTTYTASLTPESNQHFLNTLSVTFTTLPEVTSPAVVSVSDSGPHQVRVSWGPLQPAVQRYRVEYGVIPSGHVQTVTLHSHQNSTLLTGLEPGTTYLVTVSALYATGKEKAMSVKACTQEAALPALADLQLTRTGQEGAVQVEWRGPKADLRGYWLSWEAERNTQRPSSKPVPSSVFLPPGTQRHTHLAPSGRVCVSPVYRSGRGDGICCTAEKQTDTVNRG